MDDCFSTLLNASSPKDIDKSISKTYPKLVKDKDHILFNRHFHNPSRPLYWRTIPDIVRSANDNLNQVIRGSIVASATFRLPLVYGTPLALPSADRYLRTNEKYNVRFKLLCVTSIIIVFAGVASKPFSLFDRSLNNPVQSITSTMHDTYDVVLAASCLLPELMSELAAVPG